MYCSKCGAQNPDDSSYCIKCGNNLKAENIILSTPHKENKGTFEQFDIISQEIEKLGFIYKLGFYIEGFLYYYFSKYIHYLLGQLLFTSGEKEVGQETV